MPFGRARRGGATRTRTGAPKAVRRPAGADDPVFEQFYAKCKPYTMTSRERSLACYDATNYVLGNDIPGAFVECGVWRGGSAMMAALVLEAAAARRDLYLFDTFQGMPLPEDVDVDLMDRPAIDTWRETQTDSGSEWCFADRADVEHNLLSTGFSPERLHLVEGDVVETIPEHAPGQIAFLHLDTDWYRSTKHELEHLFPRLSRGGVLMIDDYGHWQGARQATDEYLKEQGIQLLLHRVDYTGRAAVKWA
jgi:O-methyltransferase